MSQNILKRKLQKESEKLNCHISDEDNLLLLLNEDKEDTTDDELSDSDFVDDVEDNFDELNLSDSEEEISNDNIDNKLNNVDKTKISENESATSEDESAISEDESATSEDDIETSDVESAASENDIETSEDESEISCQEEEFSDNSDSSGVIKKGDDEKRDVDKIYGVDVKSDLKDPQIQTIKPRKERKRNKESNPKIKVLEKSIVTSVSSEAKLKTSNINNLNEKSIFTKNESEKRKRHRIKKNRKETTKDVTLSENNISEFHKNENINEYLEDSSDEEDLRNTIGNVPINWYDEYPHLGYGLDSLPIMKPAQGDKLDQFLDRMENPDYFRTVFDKQTGQQVKLSDEHLDFINRVMNHKVPNANFDLYEAFPDLYSHEISEMPLSGRPEHKRSFIPSRSERHEVVRLATLIKKGLLRRRKLDPTKMEEEPKFYDIWKPQNEDDEKINRISDHIAAPKMPLPAHQDSYNPPPEYLVNRHDEMTLKGKKTGDRELFEGFWRKFKSIREIPGYPKTVKERFERLMDLYLTPRKRYQKVVAKSTDFLPNLPDKKDLRPYPTMEEVIFKGHRSIIRTISIHPGGKYVASGSDDHTVRIWEISTGRCLRTFEVEEAPKNVTWNPNPKLFLVAVAMGRMVIFLNPENNLTDKLVVQQTNSIFKEEVDQGDYIVPERIKDAVNWRKPTEQEYANGYRLVLDHFKEVKQVVWHKQGDYFATVIPEGDHRSVLMHQLSRWRSQVPFNKNKGRVQTVAFHPKLSQLFVVTQTHIRVYDLQRQGLIKKIQANSRWVSCIDVHPGGEHFIIGGYDRRVNWFEMEYTKRPHLMRYHVEAVRSIKFHRKYPLYASCSDDGRVVVSYGMVYDDWLKDPLIVPLKQLKGHKKFDDLYVLDLAWHPYEPYLLTAGADATIRLWH